MKKNTLFITMLLLLTAAAAGAQQILSKPAINNKAYINWNVFNQSGRQIISNDGKYICYEDASKGWGKVILRASNGTYQLQLDATGSVFTADNKRLVFNSPEGVGILELGTEKPSYLKDATEFTMPKKDNSTWLCYSINGDWILHNLRSQKETKYKGAIAAQFNPQGSLLVVQQPDALIVADLATGTEKVISREAGITDINFDTSGNKVCFLTSGAGGNTIHYFQDVMDSAKLLVSSNTRGIGPRFSLTNDPPKFSVDGERIFFRVEDVPVVMQPDSDIITKGVDVWHYKDEYLQLFQLNNDHNNRHYLSVISTSGGHLFQLENADSMLIYNPDNKYAIVNNIVNNTESYWNKRWIKRYDLVSTVDGSRKVLAADSSGFLGSAMLSPGEKFVVWFDPINKSWISYEISTGIKRNISKGIHVPLNNIEGYSIALSSLSYRSGGWLAGDKAIFIYDQFDIWQVDPLARTNPINITNAYGRRSRTTLRIVPSNAYTQTSFPDQDVFLPTQQLILAAFNQDNKYNGFYKKRLGKGDVPQLLCMKPCLYYFPEKVALYAHQPIKAKDAEIYLITRQTAADAPNLFITEDFKTFKQLTDIQPQASYNWMTSQLVKWKMLNGQIGQGILYKPENFDPSRKYPVIFKYYEHFSEEVYVYKRPQGPGAGIDIPWYVSNGYLVFVPDIIYKAGHTGQSVVNSVVSAAKYLCTFPWVDKTKLGLHGHSFGGYETNYLVTHSNLFACAQEGAGMSDMISNALGLGGTPLYLSEVFQENLRTTPWERPEIYVENSPVFKADKVTTPLLIMHNTGDDNVPFTQAAELFIALRRLEKPVWILQYDGEGHTLGGKAAEDFSIRRKQFFAHYLKGAPAPIWMTEGIPAKYKGIKSGLALDKSGNQP